MRPELLQAEYRSMYKSCRESLHTVFGCLGCGWMDRSDLAGNMGAR